MLPCAVLSLEAAVTVAVPISVGALRKSLATPLSSVIAVVDATAVSALLVVQRVPAVVAKLIAMFLTN